MSLSKEDIRNTISTLLQQKKDAEYYQQSDKISQNILQLLSSGNFQDNCTVGGFTPLRDESCWHTKFNPQICKGRLCFPALFTSPNLMTFHVAALEELEIREDFGVAIKVPRKNAPECRPQILLIPGVAFTRKGLRLGRGKGFYDRYLATFKGVKIGVCFKEQVLKDIPKDSHDQQMDYVITDEEIIEVELEL